MTGSNGVVLLRTAEVAARPSQTKCIFRSGAPCAGTGSDMSARLGSLADCRARPVASRPSFCPVLFLGYFCFFVGFTIFSTSRVAFSKTSFRFFFGAVRRNAQSGFFSQTRTFLFFVLGSLNVSARGAAFSHDENTPHELFRFFFLQRSFEFAIFETLFFPGSVAAELMETFKSMEITNFSFDPGR